MPLIEWTCKLELGVKSIDKQHQRLVKCINKLDETIKSGHQFEEIGSIFHQLIEYTQSHFKYEERLFDVHKYSDEKNHKQLHEELIIKVQDFHYKFKEENNDISMELLAFLKDWLEKHILIEDKKYTTCLIENGVS